MSGDVQPRKRKDKKKKKDEVNAPHFVYVKEEAQAAPASSAPGSNGGGGASPAAPDELIHVYKESRLGGNICAKIVFFLLLGTLTVMVGLIITEYRGSNEVESVSDSPWSQMLEGWIDDSPPDKHDDDGEIAGVDHDEEHDGDHDEEGAHSEEGEEDDEEHDEESAVFEQEHEARVASNAASEPEVSHDDDNDEEEDEDQREDEEYDREEQGDIIDKEEEDNNGEEDEDKPKSNEEEEDEDQKGVGDNDVSGEEEEEEDEEEFVFREIPGVSAADVEDQDGDDGDENDEEIDGQDAVADQSEERDLNDDDDNDGDGHEPDEQEANEAVSRDADEDENDSTGLESEFSHMDQRGDQEEAEDVEESREAMPYEEVDSKTDDEYEEVVTERAAPLLEKDDGSNEQQLELEDDFEEIADGPAPPETAKNDEESEGFDPTGVALKFGVGIAIILVAHVVLVRKWNESDETGATTLQATPAVPRRQTLIPPSVDPSNLIPESDDAEDYSDEEYDYEEDEDEDVDPIQTKVVRESLMSKYGKMSPEGSEEEEIDEEEEEGEEEVDDEELEDDEEEDPEQEYDKRYGFKLPLNKVSQLRKDEGVDEDVEEDEEDYGSPWKKVTRHQQDSDPEISGEELSGSENEHVPPVIQRSGGPKDAELSPDWPIGPDYPPEEQSAHTQEAPHLSKIQAQLDENPAAVLEKVIRLLAVTPNEPSLISLQAQALDKLAEVKRSNKLLEDAISAYWSLLQLGNVTDDLFLKTADRCINRMRFRGQHNQAVRVHKMLIARFPKAAKHRNDLAVSYLMLGKVSAARSLLKETLQLWPSDGFALVHYGFILKTNDNNNEEGAHFMQAGIDSHDPGTMDARFLFHLGDAYNRIGQPSKAEQVYNLGVQNGLFRSKHQRSLYNVDRLTARPWWTLQQTSHERELRKFESRWKEIRDEGLVLLESKNNTNAFKDEAENLRDRGVWKQLELYSRGHKIEMNCKRAPITCQLIAEFPAASSCRRGQAKFSVMQPNTHVWPHCGPTNCRLRAHLGLVVPRGTEIRVGEEKRSWQEGKILIFDDSFEHEVWHNGTSKRLVLIVDFWHPELSAQERRSLPAI